MPVGAVQRVAAMEIHGIGHVRQIVIGANHYGRF
jgi:hypothetical protein